MTFRSVVFFVGTGLLCLPASSVDAQGPSVDSVVMAAQRLLAACDSQIVEMIFVTMVHERELRDDGTIKKEKSFKIRHFIRGEQDREVLEAMWEDGEPILGLRLANEQRKREKERLRRLEERRKNPGKSDGDRSRSLSMLQPFQPNHRANYEFPSMTEDTLGGIRCWRIVVSPLLDDDKLVEGALWVEQESCRAVAEEYEIVNPPGPARASSLWLEHTPLVENCAVPRHIRVRGQGKAFLIISFNFELEMFLDSVQVNPGLPDSIFLLPDAN